MAQATLVSHQIDDGQKLVTQLAQDHFDVTAAGWVKTSEEGKWSLYIASKEVDDKGPAAAYRAVRTAIQHLPDLWVDPFDVKLIGPTDPIAVDLVKVQRGHRSRIPARFRGPFLGGVSVDEAFIYPALPPG